MGRILKAEIAINGCGRTDSHVHASQYFFHTDIDRDWDPEFTFRLNKNLPPDISVFDVIPVEGEPHARLDAIERTYNYFIHTYEDPFLSTTSALYAWKDLRLDAMNDAVKLLPSYNDYRSFCRKLSDQRTTICNITSANLYVDRNGDNIRFEISANRFVNSMIRMIVQRLIMIGRGEMSVDQFEDILKSSEPVDLFRIAHPQGLYLSKVKYPFLDLPSRSTLFNALAEQVSTGITSPLRLPQRQV